MVSIMNEALELEVGQKVLEVGTGSGWHAATIAEVIAPKESSRSEMGHVFTVEIIKDIAELARKNIISLGYGDRVTVIHGDGSKGYPERTSFDRIVVAAASPDIPQPLLGQLKLGGVMLIPVGSVSLFQKLIRIKKEKDGNIKEENLGGVAFVPLTGQYGHRH